MVKQSLREIDPKKIKEAKKVLALFEVMGITEKELNALSEIEDFKSSVYEGLSRNISNFRGEIEKSNAELKAGITALKSENEALRKENEELGNRIEALVRAQKNEAGGGTVSKKTLAEVIKENYDGKVEEFRPYGK